MSTRRRAAGWTAAAVVGHVINGSRMILATAMKASPVPPATDPRAAWHQRRTQLAPIADRLMALVGRRP
jgi:hypothetical protein